MRVLQNSVPAHTDDSVDTISDGINLGHFRANNNTLVPRNSRMKDQ